VRVNGLEALAVCGVLYPAIWAPEAGAQTENAAKPGDQLAPIQELYLPLLKEYGLLAIPLPQGQQVGDVFVGADWRLVATADECFPGLTVRSAPTELPSISGHGLASARTEPPGCCAPSCAAPWSTRIASRCAALSRQMKRSSHSVPRMTRSSSPRVAVELARCWSPGRSKSTAAYRGARA
jgi:hypothetical protein